MLRFRDLCNGKRMVRKSVVFFWILCRNVKFLPQFSTRAILIVNINGGLRVHCRMKILHYDY